jgi:hypothetical protein
MEVECALFNLGKDRNIPFWDIVRYSVYCKYYYSSKIDLFPHSKLKSLSHYLRYIKEFIIFIKLALFKKSDNLIVTASRYRSEKGKYFDASAISIINMLSDNYLVLENFNIDESICYPYIWNFCNIIRRLLKVSSLPLNIYTNISEALIKYFDKCLITYDEINTIYHNFQCDAIFYRLLFRIKRIKRLFIATGNPKAILFAAESGNITTYLLQHASIEIDEIEYSYPGKISKKDNILFCNFLLTFGNYWGKNINIPVKIISIGNDYFCTKPEYPCDNSILVVSTTIHAAELKILTKDIAKAKPDLQFIYKLHPNEYPLYLNYMDFFKETTNITVINDKIDTNILIAKSQLVILIVSAVLYQALNQNKKIAIYKKINYERNLAISDNWVNAYFFDTPDEISIILKKKVMPEKLSYYKPLDIDTLNNILMINPE